jgi:hypothetical protein
MSGRKCSEQKRALADGLERSSPDAARRASERWRWQELLADLVEAAELLKKYKMRHTSVYAAGPMYEARSPKNVAEAIETAEAARSLASMILESDQKPNRGRSRTKTCHPGSLRDQFGEELQKRGMKLALHRHNPRWPRTPGMAPPAKNVDPKLAGSPSTSTG